MNVKTISVTSFIDSHTLSLYQIGIVALCFLIVALDGFDTAAIGFLAPAIRDEWRLDASQLAPMFGAGLFGLMIGAFVCGPLADRIGRKNILLACVFCFGLASVASSYSPSFRELIFTRFLTGLGLGGALPNAITLTSEYCPKARRGLLVTAMNCGFTFGSALGGLVSAQMVGVFGWRSVLLLSGMIPLAVFIVLWWKLPESARFLVLKDKALDKVVASLKRIDPSYDFRNADFVIPDEKPQSSPVGHLFKDQLAAKTVLLWCSFFSSMLVIYLLSSWLPTLIKDTGVSLKTASIVTSMFQIGGTLGAVSLGMLMDRFRAQYVLGISYAIGGLFIATIGLVSAESLLAAIAVFGAGFFISGGQTGANAFSANVYPTDCRSTGVSWASGLGRIGAVIGSMVGGIMLSLGLELPRLFLIVSFPAIVAAASFAVMSRLRESAV